MSQKKEAQRLARYLGDQRPAFSTRSCCLKNAGAMHLRRPDQTLLNTIVSSGGGTPKEIRDQRRKRLAMERSKSTPSLDDLMKEEKENALSIELRALAPATVIERKGAVGSMRGEVEQRKAIEKEKKEKMKRKKILNAVVKSEETLALAMLKYEGQLEHVQRTLSDAIDMHKTAALQTEQIHAFDPVRYCC